eukprot:12668116-Ditylum_brightwellii.AAC.1
MAWMENGKRASLQITKESWDCMMNVMSKIFETRMGPGNDRMLENDVGVEDEDVGIRVGNDIAIGNNRI